MARLGFKNTKKFPKFLKYQIPPKLHLEAENPCKAC